MMDKTKSSKSVYDIVADKIIDKMEAGKIPWRTPWKVSFYGLPKNAVSKKDYRGVNIPLLFLEDYDCPYWASFNQISKELNGKVNKGEKSSLVIFWKVTEKNIDDLTENQKKLLTQKEKEAGVVKDYILRYYRVFNLEQTTVTKEFKEGKIEEGNWIPAGEKKEFNPIEKAEEILNGFKNKPLIEHTGNEARYITGHDLIRLPSKQKFNNEEGYYATMFHELTHSTGHGTRLKRKEIMEGTVFGSDDYSKEELIAEAGSSFMCAIAGINNTIDNSAGYIQNWLSVLKNNKRWLVCAFTTAQKAVDYILGKESRSYK